MLYISLISGVLLLIYGIKTVSDGLQDAAGPRIRALLRSLTSNRLYAVGAGALVTGLMQSSSATSVLLLGFVSAGLMTFRQTLAVILGADIGATITVQLIAFSIYDYDIVFIGLGIAFVFFSRRRLYANIGKGVMGFGFMLLAIKVMSDAMSPLESSGLFREVLIALVGSPVWGIILSAGLTALIHSSAATIGIALALVGHDLIPLDAAIHIVLGANIGTCSTALMASLGSPAEARRVAWAHVIFKAAGVLLFLPFLGQFSGLVRMSAADVPRQIANAHTIFNAVIAALFLPLLPFFAKVVTRMVPEKAEEKRFGPMYLDEHILSTPAIALGQAGREVLRASDIVREMLQDTIKAFQSADMGLIVSIKDKDNMIDMLDRQIRLYLMRLSSSNLGEAQSRRAVALLEITRDLENIGDIIDRNMMPLAEKRINKGLMFSEEGLGEIISFHRRVMENFDTAISAFAANDAELAARVLRNKEDMGQLERDLVQAHLERLRKGLRESIETSHIHLDILGNLARINSLITHIAYPIVEHFGGRTYDDVGIERPQSDKQTYKTKHGGEDA